MVLSSEKLSKEVKEDLGIDAITTTPAKRFNISVNALDPNLSLSENVKDAIRNSEDGIGIRRALENEEES